VNYAAPEGRIEGHLPIRLLGGGLLLFKFQTFFSRSLENHGRRNLPRFKTQGTASAGEVFVPGDEEVPAFETVDFFFFHDRKEPRGAKRIGPSKKTVLGNDFCEKNPNHNYGENQLSHYPRKKTGEASEPAF
jgi:hypothetical protein